MASTSGNNAQFCEGQSITRPPLFQGKNYGGWKERMEVFLQSVNIELWYIVIEGPFEAKIKDEETGKWRDKRREELIQEDRENLSLNAKALLILYNALDAQESSRIKGCKSAKEAWDMLKKIHEGSTDVQEEKKSLLVTQYENFKMEPHENIDGMFCRFNNLIKDLEALGKEYPLGELNRKILNALPKEWEPKCIAIEESKNLRDLPMEQLVSSLTLYELKMKARILEEEEAKEKKAMALKAKQNKMKRIQPRSIKEKSGCINITWEEEKESSDEEEWENNMCFMAISNDEVTHSQNSCDDSEVCSNCDENDDISFVLQLYDELKKMHAKNKALKLKLDESLHANDELNCKIKCLLDECSMLRKENVNLCAKVNSMEYVKVEHANLKKRFDDLDACFSKFTTGKKNLDKIIAMQKPVEDKSGLGYTKTTTSTRNYFVRSSNSYVPNVVCGYCNQHGHLRVSCSVKKGIDMGMQSMWVEKKHLKANPKGPMKCWVPKLV